MKRIKDATQLSQNWKQLQPEIAKGDRSSSEALERKRQARKLEKQRKKQRKAQTADNLTEQKPSASGQEEQIASESNTSVAAGPLAIDCEFVGVGVGGEQDCLARVSLVDAGNECVYDAYVRPECPVVDWRTAVSGIRPSDMRQASALHEVQERVRSLVAGRVLVGHGVRHDLQVLGIVHPKQLVRDTSKFRLFREMLNRGKRTPSLKLLAKHILGVTVQNDEHCSIEDARVAMSLYQMHKKQWKSDLYNKRKRMRQHALGDK